MAKDKTLQKACNHQIVDRTGDTWACTTCKEQFLPLSEAGDMIAAQVVDQADMVASVASAMLWDFHERAVARYGPEVARAVEPERTDDKSMFEYDPETCPGHEWNGSQCILCGSPKWLG